MIFRKQDSRRRRFLLAGVAITLSVSILAAPAASAGASTHWRGAVDLVVLGDSYASGVGNTPYSDDTCKRSRDFAYGPLLARAGLVRLQAFPACTQATTLQILGTGPHGEPSQLGSITTATDVVTVQSGGNDLNLTTVALGCAEFGCSLASPEIQGLLALIATQSPLALDSLYSAIKRPGLKTIAVGYANPLPAPGDPVGPFCGTRDLTNEIVAFQTVIDALNAQIRAAAIAKGFRYADPKPWFRYHDVCGSSPAFFTPGPLSPSTGDPAGLIHPNRFGQVLYAAAVAKQVLR